MGDLTRRMREVLSKKGDMAAGEPLSFAGRLDPAASGECIYISGAEDIEKWRPVVNAAKKTYKAQFLIGVKTDTGDLFGKVTGIDTQVGEGIDPEKVQQTLLAQKTQHIPHYSSPNIKKILKGKAAENKEQEIQIFGVRVGEVKKISIEAVRAEVNDLLEKIKGDFRYDVIRESWNDTAQKFPDNVSLIECEITCSGGTYIRALCEQVAKNCCVFSLGRTNIDF